MEEISPEVLQELEDAGWGKNPDGSVGPDYCPVGLGCCVPNMQELVDSLPKKLRINYSLTILYVGDRADVWVAGYTGAGDYWCQETGGGMCPMDALARLWIKVKRNAPDTL